MKRQPPLLALLVGGRVLVGGAALLAPRTTGNAFGISYAKNPATPFIGRMFGARAVLMAVLVAATDGVDRERQLRAGVAVDLVDALAALAAGRRHELAPMAVAAACAAALTEAALGVRLVLEPPRSA